MTNCEKCGNPLQPGLAACPICGTATESLNITPAAGQTAVEDGGALPSENVAQAVPTTIPAPSAVEIPSPVQTVSIVSEPAPVVQTMPSAPAPTVETTPTVTPAPVIEQPVAAPVIEPTSTPSPTPVQPVVESNNVGNAIPAPVAAAPIPAPVPAPAPAPAAPVQNEIKKEKKKKNNYTVTIIVAIITLVLGAGGGYLLSPSLKPAQVPTSELSEETIETKTINLNGYQFDVADGWQYSQMGDKILINTEDEKVFVRIAIYEGAFENMNTQNIESTFLNKEGYSNTKVEKTTLGNRDAIIINTTKEKENIQYYYFGHTSNKVLSMTVIYSTSQEKENYEKNINKLAESIQYKEELINAITAIEPYSSVFEDSNTVYNDSLNNKTIVDEQQNPDVEQPQTNPEEQPVVIPDLDTPIEEE